MNKRTSSAKEASAESLRDHNVLSVESLWPQLLKKAITGPLAGKRLTRLPSIRSSWKAWKKRRPNTLVLSTDTGYDRDYSVDPYKGYYKSLGIWFPVGDVRKDLSPKEMVLGIEVKGEAKAYPLSQLRERPGIVEDEVGGETIQIAVAPHGEVTAVYDHRGNPIPPTFSYWFAWQAFHPETTVYREEQ